MPDKETLLQAMKERALSMVNRQQFDDARSLYTEICSRYQDDAEAWFMLGAVNGRLGNITEAVRCGNRAVALKADYTEAYYNLAQACRKQRQYNKSIEYYRKVLKLDVHHEPAQTNLVSLLQQGLKSGNIKISTGVPGKGVPSLPDQLIGLGNAAREQGAWGEALAWYKAVLEQWPGYPTALQNLGLAYQDLLKPDEAVHYFRQLVEARQNSAEARFTLGNALRVQMSLSEAIAEYDRALQLQPDNIDILHNLGIVRMHEGEPDLAVDIFRKVLARDSNRPESRSSLLLNLNYRDRDSETVFREHLEWEKYHQSNVLEARPDITTDPARKLRIGYVSPDFRAHSVAFFIEPVLAHHDGEMYEVFCYSSVLVPDFVTRRMQRLASTWREVAGMTHAQLAEQIRRDRIDILVDLTGHTANNRLEVFAARPAPVQVTYLGYPNTTGMAAMDYRITDARADPPGLADKLHTETLVRLPTGFLCYDPHQESMPDIGDRKERDYITFGSFNNLAKVTPGVLDVWSEILHKMEGSCLLMKSKSLRDQRIRERIFGQFEDRGIGRERLELHGWFPGRTDHLALYGKMDIALDTFPYNGTTTTCEALWMGLPVVTLAGGAHAGRVGVSLLSQVGLGELIAEDRDAYIECAVALAGDRAKLQRYREGLRTQMAASALCDPVTFTRNLEGAYRVIWEKFCSGLSS